MVLSAPENEERALFVRGLHDFVAREVEPQVAGWEEAGALPRDFFARLGELGFLGLRFSPDHGGGGLDFHYTAALARGLAGCGSVGVAVSVLAHAEFATAVIDRVGTSDQKEEFLRPAIAGERIGALGVTEPDAGSDVASLRTRAVRSGDDYVVNGAKTFITNGGIADYVTTAVRTGGAGHAGISLLVVPTDAPGFVRGRRLRKLGVHAADTAELAFEDCRVPARYLLGGEGAGFRLILQGFEGERLVLAVLACAQMRLLWEEARRYGHERHAFGRPLLAFQVWQHRLADALATIEAAEALTGQVIDEYVGGEATSARISAAKLFATEGVRPLAAECAQIFGGNGFMEEYRIARLVRDSLAFTVGAGTSEMMRELIARGVGLVPGAVGR